MGQPWKMSSIFPTNAAANTGTHLIGNGADLLCIKAEGLGN